MSHAIYIPIYRIGNVIFGYVFTVIIRFFFYFFFYPTFMRHSSTTDIDFLYIRLI